MNLLGAALYDPSSPGTKATSSLLAMTAVDTTNLRLAITVPSHGKVLFKLRCAVHGATTFPVILLGAMNGATILGRVVPAYFAGTAPVATQTIQAAAEFVVTGLTPGAMNVDAAYGVEIVVAATNIKYGGPNNTTTNDAWGAFSFEAWDPQPIPTATPGAASGLLICGSNAATTFATLTSTGAFSINGTNNVSQTGDNFARLGAPAGASLSADTAAVKADTAAIKTKTDFLPSATAGAAGGVFIAGTNAATTITTSFTTTFTGNLTGSVASVTGAVGSVTGAVGSVTGAVGSVTGAVGSVTGVTFPATVASPTNITAATGIVLSGVTHTGAVIPTVTTVGTLTTYTGNTPQTGDSFARIGATGSGLTSLAPSATALSTGVWTAPPTGFLAATFPASVGTSTLTQTQVTGGAYAISSASCVLGDARIANLDATISSRGTSTLTQTQVSGGAYALNSASFAFNAALDLTTTQKTAAENAVWNAATASHNTTGTMGFTLANIPSVVLTSVDTYVSIILSAISGVLDTLSDIGTQTFNNTVIIMAVTDKLDTTLQSDGGSGYQFTVGALALIDSLVGISEIYGNVANIGVVTLKLDSAMEADGLVYRFTINALEQAPAGGGGGGLSAAGVRAAIGMATANLDTQLLTISTKTALITAGNVTVRSPVTLTGNRLDLMQGDTWVITLEGLGNLTGATQLWFAIKSSTEQTDADALVMVNLTTGLITLNGATGTAALGSIVVDDATAGDITITVDENASLLVPPGSRVWAVKQLIAGVTTTTVDGEAYIADATVESNE